MSFATLRPLLIGFGLSLGIVGCDLDPSELDVTAFEDGVSKDTEGGAFRVVLNARPGLEVGSNELVAHVGFHDPSDPDGPGYGVPSARVYLDVFPIDGDCEAVELEGVHVGEGRYEFDHIELSDPGAWQFEFNIEVGATLDESVAFAFEIAD